MGSFAQDFGKVCGQFMKLGVSLGKDGRLPHEINEEELETAIELQRVFLMKYVGIERDGQEEATEEISQASEAKG